MRRSFAMAGGPDGQEISVGGTVFAPGANALFNAAILLRPGVTSSALGRYLQAEPS